MHFSYHYTLDACFISAAIRQSLMRQGLQNHQQSRITAIMRLQSEAERQMISRDPGMSADASVILAESRVRDC